MVFGIGCDIVDHALTKKVLNWESDYNTLHRLFTIKELALYENQKNIRFLMGRFASKEAILKCIGTGMQDGISLKDIEISQMINGQPHVELFGEVKRKSDDLGIKRWHLSISHSANYSVAFVIAETN